MSTNTNSSKPTFESVWAALQETDRRMKELQKEISGIGNSNGEVAESYFVNNFEKNLYFAHQKYDSMGKNINKNIKSLNHQR